MPVTMGGMASGMDTDSIIQKLMEVEARPIAQLEESKYASNQRKEALGKLKTLLTELETAARNLYGLNAAYDGRSAVSSDPSVIEAKAGKGAEKGNRRIRVISLASVHKVATDPVAGNETLPGGIFSISIRDEKRTIRFKGGTIRNLRDQIEAECGEILSSSLVNTEGDSHVMTLESKTSGVRGEIQISGDRDMLMRIGLVKGEKGAGRDETEILFDKKYFSNYTGGAGAAERTGSLSVGADGSQAGIKGTLWQEYRLPLDVPVTADTVFEITVGHNAVEEEAEERVPSRVELGPEEKINVKGIELQGYNVSRTRPPDQKGKKARYDSPFGVGIVSGEGPARVEKIYPMEKGAKGRREIPVGRDFQGKKISRVIFYCNEGTAEFSQGRLVTPKKGQGTLEPKNEIAKAADAKMKVDGIDVTRDRNEEITDVVKGVTLNLRQAADRDIEIRIDVDIERAIENIRKFVQAYNNYLDYHRELIKSERIEKPGDEGRKKRNQNGLFVGDMTIIRLENTIKQTVNGAYTSRAEKPVRMLSQMGVSSGNVNSDWENIKQGKLQIDEAALRARIIENPEGVEQFFGADTDGDNRPDTGMAFSLIRDLKPYIGFGKNIINAKIDYENENIKSADARIERHRQHLVQYEQKLRQKFSAMEKSISGARNQQNWMNQQMGGSGGSGNKEK